MYVIERKSKRGGFWDEKTKKVVEKIETKDGSMAEAYKQQGYVVTSEPQKKGKEKTDGNE